MKPKTHVFFQDPENKLFTFGNKKHLFTEREVDLLCRALPSDHNVIRIIWADPETIISKQKI